MIFQRRGCMRRGDSPGDLAAFRYKRVSDPVNQKLLQVADIRHDHFAIPEGKARGQDAFHRGMKLGRTHSQLPRQPGIRPWLPADGDQLQQDQNVLGL